MIKLMVLRWEEYLGLSVSAQRNCKDPYEREARESQAEADGSTAKEARVKHFADGREGHDLEQTKKQILLEPPGRLPY